MGHSRATCVVASLWLIAGCGKDDFGGGEEVDGAAEVLHGPSGGSTAAVALPPPLHAADGRWQVSPDQGTATLISINFFGAVAGTDTASVLEDCEFTWTRGDDALSSLLTCPFTIYPGTYIGLSVEASTTFRILIDDATNGLFTDPSSSTKLSTVAPAGGADFVDFVVPSPGGSGDQVGFQSYFTTPLVIEEAADPIGISLVVDMTHTMEVDVAGGVAEFRQDFTPVPLYLFGSAGEVGRATFYTGLGTADNTLEPALGFNTMRFFYTADQQPVFVWSGAATAGCQNGNMPSNAWSTSPDAAPAQPQGGRIGGYLGLDSTDTLCWALPADSTWDSYGTLFAMPEAASLGEVVTVSCDTGGNVPPPTSGANYTSGCPAFTPTGSGSLTLVAN